MNSKFDITEYLDSPEVIAAYLNQALEDGDVELFAGSLGDVARAVGMTSIAEKTGLGRESLYKTLSGETRPRVDTLKKILEALDLKLQVIAAD